MAPLPSRSPISALGASSLLPVGSNSLEARETIGLEVANPVRWATSNCAFSLQKRPAEVKCWLPNLARRIHTQARLVRPDFHDDHGR